MRRFVVSTFAIEFGEVQAQLDWIELPSGTPACRHGCDRGFVFGDGVGLPVFFLRQQRANGVQAVVIGVKRRGAVQVLVGFIGVAEAQVRPARR